MALKTPYASPVPLSSFFLPKFLAANGLFTVSVLLPFLECRRVGIMQCVAFSDWLLVLSNMHLRSIYVFFVT